MSRSEDGIAGGPIAVFAPARVDLSPGFTDVEPFCREMRGLVVNVALDIGVLVVIGTARALRLNPFVTRLCNAVARRLAIVRPNVRLSVSSLPPGSGLGASGALSVALAFALTLHAGRAAAPVDLVELACAAEREAGLIGGTQDQLASMYGGAGLVRRYRDAGERVPIETDLETLGDRLVLVHAGGSRNSGFIIEQVLRERPRSDVVRTIAAMNQIGELLARSLRDGDYNEVAALMNESTALLRALHPAIVGDGVPEQLHRLGASAVKPCGAGGTGAVWAVLVDPVRRLPFVAGVLAAGWSVLSAAPTSAGARRVHSTCSR